MAKPKNSPSDYDRPPIKAGAAARGGAARGERERAAQRAHAEAMRQAECAAMLIAVTRLLLNMRGRDYAAWLRSVADDFDATDLDQENPDDVSDDLIRMGDRERRAERDQRAGNEESGEGEEEPADRRRPH